MKRKAEVESILNRIAVHPKSEADAKLHAAASNRWRKRCHDTGNGCWDCGKPEKGEDTTDEWVYTLELNPIIDPVKYHALTPEERKAMRGFTWLASHCPDCRDGTHPEPGPT